MDDRPSGGGAANTPPFPRLVRNEPENGPSSEASRPRPFIADAGGRQDDPDIGGPGHRADDPADSDDAEPFAETRRSFTSGARHGFRQRAESGLHRGFERIADRLEEAAERLEFVAEERLLALGPTARASDLAFSAAGWIGELSDYLRNSELDTLRADLERQVRERPIQTLLLAAGAGWLLGKILR